MPRRYDRLIRFYDSWFDDIADSDKMMSAEEQLSIINAIRECQVTSSLSPLENLDITIRRSLSMSTMREQITRILEKTHRMQQRGAAGGLATAAKTAEEREKMLSEKVNAAPTADGVERNAKGMADTLKSYGLYEEEICQVLDASNYGKIGDKAWQIIFSAKDKQHKREYVLKAMGLPIQQQLF